MNRRGFIQLFFAASAAIVATPRALAADTSLGTSTALVTLATDPVEHAFLWDMAGYYAELAMDITLAAQVPAKYLWGSSGVPTQMDYYTVFMRKGDAMHSLTDAWQMKELHMKEMRAISETQTGDDWQ